MVRLTASHQRAVFASKEWIWLLVAGLSIMLSRADCLAAGPALEIGRLKTSGNYFTDDLGRVVILRGVNVAGTSKVPPFLPLPKDPSFEQWNSDPVHYSFVKHTDFEMLKSLPGWGVNVLRLVFCWEAYEPLKGGVNSSYLDMLAQIANKASQMGIYTIIDFHQDVYSRYRAGGCGDGFPSWATATPHATPTNNEECQKINWMIRGWLDPGVGEAFGDFFSDKDRIKTAYLQRLEDISQRFSGEAGIIGYDLLNEPFSDPLEEDLSSLYQAAAIRIWQGDKRAILFLEPNLLTDTGKQTLLLSRPVKGEIAYAPHFYDPSIALLHAYTTPDLAIVAFENMKQISVSWKAPLFVGEFGTEARTKDAAGYIGKIYELLDQQFASGAQWNFTPGWKKETFDGWNMEDFSIVTSSTSIRSNLFKPRPYAEKINGGPISTVSYSSTDSDCVDLKWSNNPANMEETLFFVPKPIQGDQKLKIDTMGLPSAEVNCVPSEDGFHVGCESSLKGTVEVTIGYSEDFSKCSNTAHSRTNRQNGPMALDEGRP